MILPQVLYIPGASKLNSPTEIPLLRPSTDGSVDLESCSLRPPRTVREFSSEYSYLSISNSLMMENKQTNHNKLLLKWGMFQRSSS